MSASIEGVWPQVVTPFSKTGAIDLEALDRLVEWYISAGVSGLMILLEKSGEANQCSDPERLEVTQRVVTKVAGRIGVICGGAFGGPMEQCAKLAVSLSKLGVAALALESSHFSLAADPESKWKANMELFLLMVPRVRFVLVETSRPVSAETLAWVATTGRFDAFVEGPQSSGLEAKAAALSGATTPVSMFTSESAVAARALALGVKGLTGFAVAVEPHAHVWLVRHGERFEDFARQLCELLAILDSGLEPKAPVALKQSLLPRIESLTTFVRAKVGPARLSLTDRELRALTALLAISAAWLEAHPMP